MVLCFEQATVAGSEGDERILEKGGPRWLDGGKGESDSGGKKRRKDEEGLGDEVDGKTTMGSR